MSTVKATHFEHPSASTAGITLAADGSVVLPQGFTGGLGTNVVSAIKTDTFSTTSTSYTPVTGLTCTLTPTSATSKVLVTVSVPVAFHTATAHTANISLFRDATNLVVPDSPGSRSPSIATFNQGDILVDTRQLWVWSYTFLDSPATTSAVDYTVHLRVTAGQVFVNRSNDDTDNAGFGRSVATITAIEVAA